MSLAAPWALLGLLALPAVWWLHRRLRRPPEVAMPSLMFLQDEDDARSLPRGRRLDAELLLALAAATLLALAAAGPGLRGVRPGRLVRVVVSGGSAARMRGYRDRVQAALEGVRAALAPRDRMVVRWLPGPPEPGVDAPRPRDADLLAEAGAGPASLRVVVSDRAAPQDAGDVRWVAVGDPASANAGLVGVDLTPTDGGLEVCATLANHAPGAAHLVVRLDAPGGHDPARTETVAVPAGGHALACFPRVVPGTPYVLACTSDARDDLASDDRVRLDPAAPAVHVDASLPAAVGVRLRAALEALVGAQGFRLQHAREGADLSVVPASAPPPPAGGGWELAVEPVDVGAPAERAPPGDDQRGRGPVARDLDSAMADWVYAAGAATPRPGEEVLLARRAGTRTWPVLLRAGRRVRLAPDPLRGKPAPADSPFWPLLVENLLREAGGAGVGGGYRARGLLDDDSSRPGRARQPFDPAAVASARPVGARPRRPLRPWLLGGALLCLALLWSAPRLRRAGRRARQPAGGESGLGGVARA